MLFYLAAAGDDSSRDEDGTGMTGRSFTAQVGVGGSAQGRCVCKGEGTFLEELYQRSSMVGEACDPSCPAPGALLPFAPEVFPARPPGPFLPGALPARSPRSLPPGSPSLPCPFQPAPHSGQSPSEEAQGPGPGCGEPSGSRFLVTGRTRKRSAVSRK